MKQEQEKRKIYVLLFSEHPKSDIREIIGVYSSYDEAEKDKPHYGTFHNADPRYFIEEWDDSDMPFN